MQGGQILEQGAFQDRLDITRLEMIDWGRSRGFRDTRHAIETIGAALLQMQASYTVYRYDLHQYPERDDWPGWQHTGRHAELGRLYWNCFYCPPWTELHFSDQPDFWGKLVYPEAPDDVIRFWGDIGKVAPITFLRTLAGMRAGNLWISVLDAETQVIIELSQDSAALASIGRALKRARAG